MVGGFSVLSSMFVPKVVINRVRLGGVQGLKSFIRQGVKEKPKEYCWNVIVDR
jgi:hypothetical protein